MAKMSRVNLGKHFSEGARILWKWLGSEPGRQNQLRTELGMRQGQLTPILYGDHRPKTEIAMRIRRVCGIDLALWILDPQEPFIPPAARVANDEGGKAA
jgi:hypothetical protein